MLELGLEFSAKKIKKSKISWFQVHFLYDHKITEISEMYLSWLLQKILHWFSRNFLLSIQH